MRTTVLKLLNTKNNLNNICLSSDFLSPAGIGGFSLPRASLLQRAEAGEGLTSDDAIRTSGGVSAGGHDLRDPSRHTWRRDADPSHTDNIWSAQRETKRSAQTTHHEDDWHSAGEEGWLASAPEQREQRWEKLAMWPSSIHGLRWHVSAPLAHLASISGEHTSNVTVSCLPSPGLMSPNTAAVTFLWKKRVPDTCFPPELTVHSRREQFIRLTAVKKRRNEEAKEPDTPGGTFPKSVGGSYIKCFSKGRAFQKIERRPIRFFF